MVKYCNLSITELKKIAVENTEGLICSNGAINVITNRRGRSPRDKYIVDDTITQDKVQWNDNNQVINNELFNVLWQAAKISLNEKDHFIADLSAGSSPYAINLQVITEYAWHNLFCQNIFINKAENRTTTQEQWQLLNIPSYKIDYKKYQLNSEAAVLINFTQQKILLLGLEYAAEMKKAVFSV